MSSLSELLTPAGMRLDVDVPDWREALRTAGALLESQGIADHDYTQAMITSVEEKGPYIVVAPGFAFAHARPSEGVARTGLAWLRLATPVSFGHETNDPVTLVVALAAVDSTAHTRAMAQLARTVGDPATRKQLDAATSAEEVMGLLGAEPPPEAAPPAPDDEPRAASAPGRHLILTVCGNGLGTSLFLKNTLEQVLDTWGWSPFLTVEATDTISARGRASESVAILTSGEIARTLGDVGVPVRVVENFTSTVELDAALRDLYDV
ncbi:PTS sugar transporter subunit IIA [Nesterenkonia sp. HG001]|uniref:PTS sugar transporter subunit IIA n=1 Tax=Nesterenkonia sp. HG001 TaxID=2983207 RepID=UPI002AC485F2|nr:PTS sugar transporter subunit IIA [Nesterenkonia sp. HG001]MDZ5076231.1 PTS sugar transporter subunit IIA [Nesterenkonia sp. HG001]